MPGLDAWIRSVPHRDAGRATPGEEEEDAAVGGDVHLLSSCGTGRITRVVLADVSGHGPSVSDVAIGLRALMRRYVNYLDQTAFVAALNRAFAGDERGGGAGRFATSLAMTFFAPTARLDICNAGHPRPLRWDARARRWSFLVAQARPWATTQGDADDPISNLPLGVLEPTRYEQFGVELSRGDLVLAYTDAVIESRSADGQLLGEAGLLRLVEEIGLAEPASLIPALRERLGAYRDGAPSEDDETLLLLRHNGLGEQAPLLQRLVASTKFLGIVARNLVPLGARPPIPWPEFRRENLLGALVPKAARSWRADRG
jgi:serine phosphatase RsbU (regulator of sigma subunit)